MRYPYIAVVGQKPGNFEKLLSYKIGNQFTDDERLRAHKALDKSFGKEKIDAIIRKIETGDLFEFGADRVSKGKHFGQALAVSWAATEPDNRNPIPLFLEISGGFTPIPWEGGVDVSKATPNIQSPPTQLPEENNLKNQGLNPSDNSYYSIFRKITLPLLKQKFPYDEIVGSLYKK